MSEVDPLVGYTEGPKATYEHYERMKRDAKSRRHCRLTFAACLLMVAAVTATVVLLILYDPPEAVVDVSDDEFEDPHPEFLLQMPRRDSSPWKMDWNRPNSRRNKQIKPSSINSDTMNECKKRGWDEVTRRKDIENTLIPPSGPAFYQQLATPLNPWISDLIDKAVAAEATLHCLKEHDVHPEEMKRECHTRRSSTQSPNCSDRSKFRSLDGTCNNIQHPFWGAISQPFRRIIPADYKDNISQPHPAFPVGIIPPPRQVSICMQNATNQYDDTKFSMLFVHFAHFLDHDMSFIAPIKGKNGSAIPCCGPAEERHPECYSLELKSNDPFYMTKGLMCMDFVRSAPALQCQTGVREQMNQATSYIDLSHVYSTSEYVGRKVLRDIDGGYLLSPTEPDGRYMLLRDQDDHNGCNRPEMAALNQYCFKSGDARVNQFIGLTAMNQVWMREHNRVTDFFIKINPHWDDERLYQETRRVVIAEMQHVVYNEFLPLLLGENMMKSRELQPLKKGYFQGYDDNLDAGIANSFASAAFRFYHSMIKGMVAFEEVGSGVTDLVELHKMIFNPLALWEYGKVDDLIRGSGAQNPRPVHTSFAAEVANHLFQQENETFGFDLFAFDIQRGRDHGIPPYYKWREACNLPPASNFSQMKEFFRPHSLELIQRFYVDGTHLDLFTGMLAENPSTDGGILGPVASCIIADQFVRLKKGDRFWYETSDPLLRFTSEQLTTIRNITLARILCENGDALDLVQEKAMEAISEKNPRKHCAGYQIPRLDLTKWKDKQH